MDQKTLHEIGEELKKRRLALKLSVVQISKRIKIRKVYIEAIEAGKGNALPSNAYTIGYIKEYCKFLKIDYKEYLQKLKGLKENSGKLKSGASLNLITDKEFLPSIYIVLACILITLLIYLLFYFFKS